MEVEKEGWGKRRENSDRERGERERCEFSVREGRKRVLGGGGGRGQGERRVRRKRDRK